MQRSSEKFSDQKDFIRQPSLRNHPDIRMMRPELAQRDSYFVSVRMRVDAGRELPQTLRPIRNRNVHDHSQQPVYPGGPLTWGGELEPENVIGRRQWRRGNSHKMPSAKGLRLLGSNLGC